MKKIKYAAKRRFLIDRGTYFSSMAVLRIQWFRSVLLLLVETELTSPSSVSLREAFLESFFFPEAPAVPPAFESVEESLELEEAALDLASSSSSEAAAPEVPVDPRLLTEPAAVSASVPSSPPLRAFDFLISFSFSFLSFFKRFSKHNYFNICLRLTFLLDDSFTEIDLLGAQLSKIFLFAIVIINILIRAFILALILWVSLDLTSVPFLDQLIVLVTFII